MSQQTIAVNPDALEAALEETDQLQLQVRESLPAIDTDECEPFATIHSYSALPTDQVHEVISHAIETYVAADQKTELH